MVKGGNGCARDGQSAFRMETGWEGYLWGGGGGMAQKSVGKDDIVGIGGGRGEMEQESMRTSEVVELFGELPGCVNE